VNIYNLNQNPWELANNISDRPLQTYNAINQADAMNCRPITFYKSLYNILLIEEKELKKHSNYYIASDYYKEDVK